ncbi:MAG: aldolase [Planctomycetota bacterium]|nr:aldolase [Planctomycetota bacterium]
MSEREIREQITLHGRSLYDRGYSHGSSGNISVRLTSGILITPTNSSLGRLDPDRISLVASDGRHLSGDKPSKEAFLHLAMYEKRAKDHAVVHLHSTHSVAVSCLADIDPRDVLPPVTAYYVMRVGKMPLVPYYPPGDAGLAEAVASRAGETRAMLLANHGPVISGSDLEGAVYAAEEMEESAKLFLLLRRESVRFLNSEQCAELNRRFPN